ncbi:SPOR domain-containing protein [Shewanella sp. 30m-9]
MKLVKRFGKDKIRAVRLLSSWRAVFVLGSLLCFLSTTSSAKEQEQIPSSELAAELSQIKLQLADWERLKPAIERLVDNEEDLGLLISELSKISELQHKPVKVITTTESALKPQPINSVESLVNNNMVTEFKKEVREFGIHLSSYSNANNLSSGWLNYQKRFKKLLAGGAPLQFDFAHKGKEFSRLVYGPYLSKSAASKVCRILKSEGQYCAVVNYEGKRI